MMTVYTQSLVSRRPDACPFPPHLTTTPARRLPRPCAAAPRAAAGPAFSAGHIFWDLDNLRPHSLAELASLTALISAAVAGLAPAPAPPLPLTAFANPATAASLGGAKALAAALQGDLVLTTARKQSVDLAMRGAMVGWVKREEAKKLSIQGPDVANLHVLVACVTDDADFAGALRFCGGLGAAAVAVGRHGSGRRPAWAAPRRLGGLALPAAAAAAVALRRPAGPGAPWTVDQRWVNPAVPSPLALPDSQ